MSFILDALNKSEEKRTESHTLKPEKQVLHPQLPTQKRWPLLIIGILAFTLILICAWWLGQPSETGENSSLSQLRATTNHTETTTTVAPSEPVTVEPATVNRNRTLTGVDKQPFSAPVPQRQNQKQQAQAPQTSIIAKQQTQQSLDEQVLLFTELTPNLQQKILPLDVSLHFFSPDQKRRMLRINGKIRHEKDALTKELSIYEIKEKSTIFSYQGTLFEFPVPNQ